MKTIKTWLKRAAMLSVTVAFAAAGFGANAATSLTLSDGDTLTGVYEDYEITIAAGATVTFNNATVTRASDNAAVVQTLGDATIILAEGSENSVAHTQTSGYGGAGISPAVGHTLTIDGTGSLTVQGGSGAAGIGANANSVSSCGNIVIAGGTIVATGGEGGSGIGAGNYESRCGDITITGGNVTAKALANTGSYYPPAIGAGTSNSSCGNILICGGTVTADASDPNCDYSYDIGPAIGASASNCGSITIVDGVERIVATKGANALEIIGMGRSDYTSVGKISRLLRFDAEYSNDGNTVTLTPKASFESYTVTWKNDDGTTADTTSVEYGLLPSHAGLTKAGDGYFEYLFAGWTPEFAEVESNVTYTAVFCAVPAVRSTGGAAEWFPDAGERALRSGAIEGNQNTWLQTTLSRPCVLSFKWKTSSEANCDPLVFYVDGVEHSRISGESADWSVVTLSFEDSKNHILRWVYSKDGGVNGKYDCGWIRDFVVTPYDSWAVTRELNYEGAAGIETRYVKKGRQLDVSEFPPLDGLREGYTCYWALAPWSGDALTNAVDISADTTLYARWIKQHGFDEIDTTCQEPWTWLEDGSIRTGKIGDSGNTWATISVTGPCDVSFKWKTSSEDRWDKLHFYVDADHKTDISGAQADWATYSASVDSGEHVLKWTYTKDGSGSVGEDCGWIKDVVMTAPDSAPYTVMWKNVDGSVLETDSDLAAGAASVYNSALPTLAATAQYTYEFAGWEPEFELVSSNTTYTAKYTATLRSYDVTWQNEGGTPLGATNIFYGATPEYAGETPTKAATPKFTYTFAGWDPEVAAVTGEATYTATYDATVNKYTITWQNEDGSVLGSDEVEYDDTPAYTGETPTKAADAQYTYTFAGWSPAVSTVAGEATYTATFNSILRSYTITWKDDAGAVIDTTTVNYGDTPTHVAPTKASTAQYDYTFAGWGDVVAVTGEATYQATFTPVLRNYTVAWVVEGETVASGLVAYGTTPTYAGATPTKAETAEYTYSFTGWSPAIVAVTGAATYTAQFSQTKRSYTITWANIDGEGASATSTVEYGTTPTYSGATPTKAETAEYTYTFSGWSPTVSTVTGEATYTAQFSQTKRSYTVAWVVEGVTVASGSVEYGQTPTYDGDTPTKESTAEYSYAFSGWSPAVSAVTGKATYTAQFNATKRSYTITWANIDGAGAVATSTAEYGTTPSYGGATPTKAETAEYTYTFAGWSPAVVSVTGAATYTATYTAYDKQSGLTCLAHLSFDDYGNDGLNVIKADIGGDAIVRTTPANVVDGLGEVACVTNETILLGLADGDGAVAIPLNTHIALPIPYVLKDRSAHPYSMLMKLKFPSLGSYYAIMNMPSSNNSDDMVFVNNSSPASIGFKLLSKASGQVTCGTGTAFTEANRWYTLLIVYDTDRTRVAVDGIEVMDHPVNLANSFANCMNAGDYFVMSGDPDSQDPLLYWADIRVYDGAVPNDTGIAKYTVQWRNWDDALLEEDRIVPGVMPTYDGSTPTKTATAQYAYTFAGWTPAVAAVESNTTYTATYDATLRSYTITWKNDDGLIIDTTTVAYGTTPTHAAPTKAETAEYTYTFAGWSPAVAAVTGDTVYTATFNAIPKSESGTVDISTLANGEVVQNGSVLTGTAPNLNLKVAAGATITLDGVCITNSAGDVSALHCLGDATIILAPGSENTVVGTVGRYCTGNAIYVPTNSTLTITGSGSLYADSSSSESRSAAIGAFAYPYNANNLFPCGNIVIEGGTITAKGGVGIGASGNGGYCGDITITGDANVTAIATANGSAGIGSAGTDGACGNITISGNASVTATGKYNAPGIGAADHSTCGDIVISTTGSVEATGNYFAPGIGASGGYETCRCGDITISGGTVIATGSNHSPGIGTDYYYKRSGACGAITIADTITSVTAQGQDDSPGIYRPEESEPYCTYGSNLELVKSDSNRLYILTLVAAPETFTVTWQNYDGATLETDEGVAYGTVPAYSGATPTKAEDAQYTYEFAGWTPAVVAATSNTTYTATFSETKRSYTVAWVVEGATVQSGAVEYGQTPAYDGDTPTKESTAEYSYTFTGWSPTVAAVTGDATYTAQFSQTKRSYMVSWVVEGVTVASGAVEYGQTPEFVGETPTKESTAEYNYAFTGWSPTVAAVTGDVIYIAQFSQTKRSYTVSWVVEGETVASGAVEYGTTPTYSGATPTKAETAEYTYTFSGWSPTASTVTGDATYTAQFSQTKRSYTVSWVVEGATVASGMVEYGETPSYDGETPEKAATAEYSYAFTGWNPTVVAVAGDATYTAQFEATKRSYTVTWVVEGATVASGAVEYGTTPTYGGDTPTKAETAEYTYEFTGWSPTVATVTGAATYTAQFSQTKRSYMVSWVVEGVTVASGSVEYGTTPVYNGATPTKPEDENYTYTFNGWTPAVVAVIGNATYTATFTATPKETEDPEEPYEGTETIDGIAWSYTVADGEATITSAQFAEGAIAIPETVHDGVPVMAIEEGVFADNQDITEVTISRYVRRIGADVGVKSADWTQNLEEAGFDGSYPAFGNCESLLNYRVDANNEVFEEIGGALYYRDTPANAKELALYPSGRSTLYFADGLTVTKIGDGACAWCHKFTELTIPASVREIGVRSFDFCREIVTLTIPATVTDIGWGAFLMNIALENADINGTDLAIGDYAFYHSFMADNAGNLVIRGGVKDVGFNAFCNSMHLGSVVIEDGVTNIAMNAFSQCYDLSTVTLPDTLTAIGAGAFCGCSELREIIVPLSVDEIGLSQQDDGSDGGAFAGCYALARIYLPLSLKPATVEETNDYLANVFNGLGLEDMSAAEIAEILTWYSDPSEIGGGDEPEEQYDGTETIDGVTWSFSVSNGVATITDMSPVIGDVVIPATVTNGVPVTALKDYIENLRYDDGITSITLPASVTNIGTGNFVGCTALGAINVAEGNASYSSADGILYNAGQTELLVSPGGKTVVTNMPESVVEIASGAFEGSRVQFCVMAQYATNIAERAFSGCSYLGSVSIEKHIRNIGAYAFENCVNVSIVNFPSDSFCEEIGVGAFSGCTKLQRVAIPDSVKVIRGGAFSGCSELFDVTIGSGVVVIGDATVPHYIDEWGDDATMDFDPAFGNCANLMDFKVSKDNAIYEAIDGCIYYRSTPNTAKTLAVYPSGRGDLHFYGGVTVTAIGEGACSNCNKLKKLTIPQSVKDIGIEAFAHCEGVTNVYIQANSVTNISFGAFAWNMNTMDVEVSGSVKTIGEWAFIHNFGPYNLNDDFTTGQLVLHEGIREIGRGAFERCFRIGEIEIPRSVQRMGESAFADTRLARRIVIGNGLRVIPESAFECSWGSKLSELIIGNNVVGIGACAFSGCEKLRNLNIPSAVWDIGDNAFSGCTSLCALNLPSNLKSIGAGAFGGSSYGMMMSSGRRLLGSSAQTFDDCTDLRRVLVPNSVTNIGVGAFGAVTSENLDRIYLPSSLKSADDSDTLAFLADQFPGLNLGIGDVTWYDDKSELNYVTVTFDPNNGGETESVQVLDYLDALPVPVTNGYAFAGWWTTSDDSGEKIAMSQHFAADTTLYAHWIETSVTFGEDAPWTAVYDDYHDEMVLQSGDVAFGYTSSASMTVTGPCIVGFDFMNYMDEWGTSNDLMILVDGEEVDCRGIFDWTERTVDIAEVGEHVVTWSYVNLNGSFNDYARLRNFSATPAVAHTVTFNLEGGTMAEATSRQVLHSLGALPIPVKAGYIFNGWWWTDGDGFAERVSTDFAVEDDVEFVARWEKSPFSAVGGDASWFLDENGDYRTEAIGKAATVWAELRFKGPANISFDYKASMSWMSDDHFEFVVDGERALYQGGISSWRSHSEAFSDDAEHVVRWVVRRNDYGEEDYEAENCAWLTRLNLPEAITAAETPPVEVDDTKMEEPVDNGDGTRTIAAKEGETLTQSDVASVTVASPVDPAIDITAAYTKTLVDNTIVLQLAVPALEDVPELNDDDEDPSGMLDDVDDIDDGKIAAMPEPDVSDPDPEKREEVGALPIKMYPGLYYQASWGDDLNNLTSGAKFRADGSQTHIGVIKQTGRSGFYRISVSER